VAALRICHDKRAAPAEIFLKRVCDDNNENRDHFAFQAAMVKKV